MPFDSAQGEGELTGAKIGAGICPERSRRVYGASFERSRETGGYKCCLNFFVTSICPLLIIVVSLTCTFSSLLNSS